VTTQHTLKLEIQRLVAQDHAAREDGHVVERVLAVVTKARGLDGADVQLAAELVDNKRAQSLAVNVLGNNDQRLALSDRDLEGLPKERATVSKSAAANIG
jgi:hypothetical protein